MLKHIIFYNFDIFRDYINNVNIDQNKLFTMKLDRMRKSLLELS